MVLSTVFQSCDDSQRNKILYLQINMHVLNNVNMHGCLEVNFVTP